MCWRQQLDTSGADRSGAEVAIAFAELKKLADTTDQSSLATTTFSPSANTPLIVFVWNTKGTTPDIPTLSGGLTWTRIATDTRTNRRLSAFSASSGAAPGTFAVTADFGGVTQTMIGIYVLELPNAASDATLAVVQSPPFQGASGTQPAGTMAALKNNGADAVVFAIINGNNPFGGTIEAGGDWVEQWDAGVGTPATGLYVGYRLATTDNTLSVTQGANSSWVMIAVEIAPPYDAATSALNTADSGLVALADSASVTATEAPSGADALADSQQSILAWTGSGADALAELSEVALSAILAGEEALADEAAALIDALIGAEEAIGDEASSLVVLDPSGQGSLADEDVFDEGSKVFRLVAEGSFQLLVPKRGGVIPIPLPPPERLLEPLEDRGTGLIILEGSGAMQLIHAWEAEDEELLLT